MPPARTAPATGRIAIVDWRSWPDRVTVLWRRSLRFRTVVLTLALSALAIVIACVWMALAIQSDLLESRQQQVLEDARRATSEVQRTLDSAEPQGSPAQLSTLMGSVQSDLTQQSESDSFAVFRVGPPSSIAPQDFTSGVLVDEDIISTALRDRVQSDPDLQWWQYAGLPGAEGEVPGIIVGQQFEMPDVGYYELYFAYDLAAASETLLFVQATLWIVGVFLLVMIGGIAWFVLRSVTTPIAEAADTSAKLAAGELNDDDRLQGLGREVLR